MLEKKRNLLRNRQNKINLHLLVLAPGLDVDFVEADSAEGVDEGGGQSAVGDKGHVEVDGGAAYLIAVGQLAYGKVLGYVDHEVDFVAVEHVEGLRVAVGV